MNFAFAALLVTSAVFLELGSVSSQCTSGNCSQSYPGGYSGANAGAGAQANANAGAGAQQGAYPAQTTYAAGPGGASGWQAQYAAGNQQSAQSAYQQGSASGYQNHGGAGTCSTC